MAQHEQLDVLDLDAPAAKQQLQQGNERQVDERQDHRTILSAPDTPELPGRSEFWHLSRRPCAQSAQRRRRGRGALHCFDSAEHLRAWLDSDEHAAWLERAEPHVIGPMRTSLVTGLETWFTLPGQPAAPPPPPTPPYKMALVTSAAIFPLITAIVVTTGPLLEGPPLAARLAITTAFAVPLMTWVVMPRMTRLLRGWLYPDHRLTSTTDETTP
jgi:antibiotic biosynthesis monooxygenase (ABM) superfamily enzyme